MRHRIAVLAVLLVSATVASWDAHAFSGFKGRFSNAGPDDCEIPVPGVADPRVVEHGTTIEADPAIPVLNARNSCGCPSRDYTPSVNAPARLTCIDGTMMLKQPPACGCERKPAKYFVGKLRPIVVSKRGSRSVSCPSGTVLGGCTNTCSSQELDFDLSPSGNACRVDANTKCSGQTNGFTVYAICIPLK